MNKVLIVILVLIIIVESFFIGTSKNDVQPFDDSKLLLQIQQADSTAKYWEEQSKIFQVIAFNSRLVVDSLENIKPQIQIHYETIYDFNSTASNSELDSVIRASW